MKSGSRLPSVVVDASPMLDRSGSRGIGRYVYDLLLGLESVRDEWRRELDVSAVSDIGWFGNVTRSGDLAEIAEALRPRRGSEKNVIIRKRRVSLSLGTRGADVLHLAEPIGMPLLKLSRWCVTCYDLIPLKLPEQYLGGSRRRVLVRKAKDQARYRRAERVVTISERTRTDVLDILGLRPEKVIHVPTGIDLAHFAAGVHPDDAERRARLGVGRRPYLLFVGEGDQRKGVDTMFRALAEARRTMDVELVWAGQLPPAHLARFEKMVRAEGLSGHVRFVGFAPDGDLAALYRGALADVFLSVLEGFGLPVAEAMSAGCPVIVARGSGCDEIAGDAGYVVPPGDASAAARAIVSLAKDPADRTRRSAVGLSRIARYDRKEMARGYVDVWSRMVK